MNFLISSVCICPKKKVICALVLGAEAYLECLSHTVELGKEILVIITFK